MSKIYIPRVEQVADLFGIGQITQDAWDLGSFNNLDDAVACKFEVLQDIRAGKYRIALNHYHCFCVEIRDGDSIVDVVDVIPNVEKFVSSLCAEYTTIDHINKIVDSIVETDGRLVWTYEKGKMFFAYEPVIHRWVACDNTTGDCFVEDFETMFDCLHYLYGDIDSEGNMN